MIIAQQMCIRKSKRDSSENNESQILSTSGSGNSWDKSNVIHLKLKGTNKYASQ